MGQMLGNLKNAGNIQDANLGDLDAGEKLQRGLLGGLSGGMKNMGQQQQPQGGGAPPINISPSPQYDFSQINKRNPFYGGY